LFLRFILELPPSPLLWLLFEEAINGCSRWSGVVLLLLLLSVIFHVWFYLSFVFLAEGLALCLGSILRVFARFESSTPQSSIVPDFCCYPNNRWRAARCIGHCWVGCVVIVVAKQLKLHGLCLEALRGGTCGSSAPISELIPTYSRWFGRR
jgi:hypothetical protein